MNSTIQYNSKKMGTEIPEQKQTVDTGPDTNRNKGWVRAG